MSQIIDWIYWKNNNNFYKLRFTAVIIQNLNPDDKSVNLKLKIEFKFNKS